MIRYTHCTACCVALPQTGEPLEVLDLCRRCQRDRTAYYASRDNAAASWKSPPENIDEHIVTAVLHVWFLWIDETPEQLARLGAGKPLETILARSKLGRTPLFVRPINQTAARVAPPRLPES